MTLTQRILYLIVRTGIGLLGLLVILGVVTSHFLMPELYYDEPPYVVPPLRERLPEIVMGIAAGFVLCCPHRWTRRLWLFWPRFALYVGFGGLLLLRASHCVLDALRLHRPSLVLPAMVLSAVALTLPLCLLWSRRAHDAASCA